MSIVTKTIGNNNYQYEVSWDPKKKKQVWKYIGKADTNVPKVDSRLSIGETFSNDEREAIRKMLSWVRGRSKDQAGYSHRRAASLLIERLRLERDPL